LAVGLGSALFIGGLPATLAGFARRGMVANRRPPYLGKS